MTSTAGVHRAGGPAVLARRPTRSAQLKIVGLAVFAAAVGVALTATGYLFLVPAGLFLVGFATWPIAGRILAPLATNRYREVLADAGHELRTPLTIMRGHLELLDATSRDEVADTRTLLLDEVDRMARLVDDLATLTTSDGPGFLRLSLVEVGALVDDVAAKAQTLGNRDWRIEIHERGYVVADPHRLTQALLQLLDNAVQHTGESDAVAIGCRIDRAAGDVRLWVRDTGPGVRPRDAQRIFRRFERGTAATPLRGSGLGLAIVRAIAQAHGGRVTLESTPGAGATFSVVLPLVHSRTAGARGGPVGVGVGAAVGAGVGAGGSPAGGGEGETTTSRPEQETVLANRTGSAWPSPARHEGPRGGAMAPHHRYDNRDVRT
ncbi:HAMP domain-containing sensor histidine kinase [Actinopolymorpha sp. B17G11]|uniref:sensor histidine kinase n=1 Tax=Actinopolymorpha sp. B17G11 TaxID=3160861 RepID=UPI0032E4DCF2